MLQQDRADEYVIATGETHSLRDFAASAFASVGLDWEKHTVIDPALFRPSDIDVIYGDPAKARAQLGWNYHLTFEELIQQLVEDELTSSGNALSPRGRHKKESYGRSIAE
jgi:GDPmannose 4,6-dehydratase